MYVAFILKIRETWKLFIKGQIGKIIEGDCGLY